MVFSSNAELNLYRLAEKIFAEIKMFDENLSPEFEVVATIDEKSFVLENVYSWSEELLIFDGHEFKFACKSFSQRQKSASLSVCTTTTKGASAIDTPSDWLFFRKFFSP